MGGHNHTNVSNSPLGGHGHRKSLGRSGGLLRGDGGVDSSSKLQLCTSEGQVMVVMVVMMVVVIVMVMVITNR